MALESLAQLEKTWSEEVEKLGVHLDQGLLRLQGASKHWGWIRGLGLMRGIEILDAEGQPDATRAGQLVEAMLARGVFFSAGVEQISFVHAAVCHQRGGNRFRVRAACEA